MDYRIEQLRYQLREDPSSRLFFQLGDLLRRDGQLEEAVEILRDGLDQHPRYISAWVSLGRGLHSLGDHSGAGAAFERALELDPENAVAARMVGEAAIARQDWLRAVKALKLARGLTAGDESLDERIGFVEARLDARGELQVLPQAPPADTVEPGPEREVVSLSFEDPFKVRSAGDTGAWNNVADVFEAGRVDEVEPESILSEEMVEAAPEVEAPVAVDSEGILEVEEEPPAEEEFGPGDDEAASADIETSAERDTLEVAVDAVVREVSDEWKETPVELTSPYLAGSDGEKILDHDTGSSEEDGAGEAERDLAGEPVEPAQEIDKAFVIDEIPLPTMTLARLAIKQGDRDLAEKTLRSLLARDPSHEGASNLLESLLTDTAEIDPPVRIASDQSGAKIQALRAWLNSVKLASERLAQ